MDQLQIFASDLAAEKEETHTQLRKQMQLNEQLQAELSEVTEQLLLQEQKRKQQQHKWRQDHLSAVDRKVEARNYAMKFTEAGVQADVASSSSDDSLADTPEARSTRPLPQAGPQQGCDTLGLQPELSLLLLLLLSLLLPLLLLLLRLRPHFSRLRATCRFWVQGE
ncbi:hypothetical protein Efla_005191 [Eimeria flavescens]